MRTTERWPLKGQNAVTTSNKKEIVSIFLKSLNNIFSVKNYLVTYLPTILAQLATLLRLDNVKLYYDKNKNVLHLLKGMTLIGTLK
jgi:hypothetical protein